MSKSGSFKRTPSRQERESEVAQAATLVEYIRTFGTKWSVSDLAKKRAFPIFRPSVTILEAARALSSGSHIIGIDGGPESTGGLSKVITQGALFRYLAPLLQNTATPLYEFMRTPVLAVTAKTTALRSFEILIRKGISGLPVVNKEGAIIHQTSTSDVKILMTANIDGDLTLEENIEDFLVKLRASKPSLKTKVPVASCAQTDELSAVVNKLIRTGFHRVWVVDRKKKPIGVMSLSDLLRSLVKRAEGALGPAPDEPSPHLVATYGGDDGLPHLFVHEPEPHTACKCILS